MACTAGAAGVVSTAEGGVAKVATIDIKYLLGKTKQQDCCGFWNDMAI
jgi:hypothetical protein